MLRSSFLKTVIFLFIFLLGGFLNSVSAQTINSKKDITIVNPIRGNDFWESKQKILDVPKKQYEEIFKNNFAATWLIRYDALVDKEVETFLRSLNKDQEVGLFLEITPSLTKAAGVNYNQSPNWHYAKSVLLIGYPSEDRKKLIDSSFAKYKQIFNANPKSVGAWWIDADSLQYMRDKYQIEANLDVADQFSTDQYSVWGQYWATPFYPAKNNALMPAQDENQKIGVVTTQWAIRDPYNGYGNGVFDSTFSIQGNDYLLHDLDTSYFKKLVNAYGQITVGLENDYDINKFLPEYINQVRFTKELVNSNQVNALTMSKFAQSYKQKNPNVSPSVIISADDPLGTTGKVIWFQNIYYRLGWFYGPYGSVIRDLREFNPSQEENCLRKSCQSLELAFGRSAAIDDVNFGTRWVIDEGAISDLKINKENENYVFSYKNAAGTLRTIKLLPRDVQIDDKVYTIASAILETVSKPTEIAPKNETFKIDFDFGKNIPPILVNFLKFIVLTILFFLIPGWVLSKRLLLSIPVGWSLFTLLVFVLGYLKLDFLIWLMPVASVGLLLFRHRERSVAISKIKIASSLSLLAMTKEKIALNLIIVIGSITWLLTQVKNGLLFNFGYGFWGPNGHDAVWHLSLISELQRQFPPNNPVFAGIALRNYHYFFDLLLAKSGQLFSIDNMDLLFRFYPLLISILIGYLTFFVTKKIAWNFKQDEKFSSVAGLITTFFVYFGGSFGWIVSYFRDKSFGGETMFWSQQAISTLINPPFAISVVLFLSGLYLFYDVILRGNEGSRSLSVVPLKQVQRFFTSFRMTILIALLWGTLIEFKAYGGVLVLAALGLFTLDSVIFKRNFKYLPIFILTGLISVAVFLPNNLGSNSLIIFSPLWLVYSMLESPDRLNWYRLNLALQSQVPYKVIGGTALGVLIFMLGNLGTRIFGFFNSFKLFIQNRFLIYLILIGLILPLLFIQKGNSWNIIQFMYYSLFALNIFTGVAIAKMVYKSVIISTIVLIITILLTIPTTLGTLEHYLPARPPARLSTGEIEALNFLKSQPQGIVLTLPFDQKLKDKYTVPLPLATYTSTAYVSAFSNHPTFLEDTLNLEILDLDYKGRLNLERDFAKVPDSSKRILKENNISYVYVLKTQNFQEDELRMGIKKIFENEEIEIFKAL